MNISDYVLKISIRVVSILFKNLKCRPWDGNKTFRHKTFRQQDGGGLFGNKKLPKRLPPPVILKLLPKRLETFPDLSQVVYYWSVLDKNG